MKKAMIAIIAAGVLTTVPVSEAFAATSGNAVSQGKEPVIVLAEQKKMSKEEMKQLKSQSKLVTESSISVISPEMTKSPNYSFSKVEANGGYNESPVFSHSSGDILVTLVQWGDGVFSSADCYWSVIDKYGRVVASKELTGNFTSENTTINFGSIPAGDYKIKVTNGLDAGTVSGNFFIYY